MTAVLKPTTARMVVVRLGSCIMVVGFVELFDEQMFGPLD